MTDLLHPATRAILSAESAEAALDLARALASAPPADFNPGEWRAIAAVGSSARARPGWYALNAFAHEQLGDRTAEVDALSARGNLICALGPDETQPFRSMAELIAKARGVVGKATPDAERTVYAESRRTLFSAPRGSLEWNAASQTLLHCRRLRQLAGTLARLAQAGIALPHDLAAWQSWATLDEGSWDVAGSNVP